MAERRYPWRPPGAEQAETYWWNGEGWEREGRSVTWMGGVVPEDLAAHLATEADRLRGERDEARREGRREALKARSAQSYADHFCSDCHGKHHGQRCYRCQWQEAQNLVAALEAEVERLNGGDRRC